MSKKPVLVLPDDNVMDGVVASVTVTAPESWLAPVDVLNVPVPPEKSLEVEPEAVIPALTAKTPPLTVNPPVAVATVMAAEPSNDTPPIVLAVCNIVAV